jgi:hypothetical protein
MRGLYLWDVTDYQLPRSAFEKMTSTEIILCFIIKCTVLFGGCFCRQRCMFQTGEWKVQQFLLLCYKEINLFPNIDQIKCKLFKSTVSFSEIIQHKLYMCTNAMSDRDLINRRILKQGNYTYLHILMKLATLLTLELPGLNFLKRMISWHSSVPPDEARTHKGAAGLQPPWNSKFKKNTGFVEKITANFVGFFILEPKSAAEIGWLVHYNFEK